MIMIILIPCLEWGDDDHHSLNVPFAVEAFILFPHCLQKSASTIPPGYLHWFVIGNLLGFC